MKKYYYFFLLLIFNVSFLYSEDVLSDIPEEQNIQAEGSLTESITNNPSASFPEQNLTNTDISRDEIAILETNSFRPGKISPDELTIPEDLKIPTQKLKSSFLAVALSTLIPGLGHAYLGDYKKASAIFGSSALGAGALFNDHTMPAGLQVLNVAASYSIYAAYRDVRLYNNNVGYSYKMPTDSFKELSLAPFSLKVLKKPEVWGGFLGALAIGSGIIYLQNKLCICKVSTKNATPLIAFPTGISEETLFRGYLQSSLSETLTPIGGIILSSLAFGAAHIPNAQLLEPEDRKNYYAFSLPFITSFGVYFGWMTYKNRSLQESVALHSWYDFTLFAIASALTNSAMVGKPNFSFSFSF